MLKFLKLLTKWRKVFIINLLVIAIFSVVISLTLPNWYKASAVIQPPKIKQSSGGISSLLGMLPLSGLGLNLGIGGEESIFIAILKSRSLAINTIRKFDLMQFYERETLEETLKDFYSDYDVQPTEENMIEISYQYTDSVVAARIVNFIIDDLGKKFIELSLQAAQYEKDLIEKRYEENVSLLDSLFNELESFQKQYGIIEFEEQTKALMTAAASIEAEILIKKAEQESYEQLLGENHPYTISVKTQVESLEGELLKIKSQQDSNDPPFKSLFVPFEKLPEIGKKYAKLYTWFLLESKLQEYLLPQLEQAKLQLLKDTPSIQVIDKAIPPDYKSKPRRSIIVAASVFVGFIITYLIILMIEHLLWLKENNSKEYADWVLIKTKWLQLFRKSKA